MRAFALALAVALAVSLPAPAAAQASAQASVDLRLELPVVLPQLVVVTPGVQVVPEVDAEVFFVDGFYWVRHDRGWYRSSSHRGGWALVPARGVPAKLVKIPAGKYRRFKPGKAKASGSPHDEGRGKGKKHGKHR